jgi:ribose transport system permease protein
MVVATDGPASRWRAWLEEYPVLFSLAGLLALAIAMTLVSDRFLAWENLANIGRQVSINAIIATGMTLVIITGGIDLSVGAVMTLSMHSKRRWQGRKEFSSFQPY